MKSLIFIGLLLLSPRISAGESSDLTYAYNIASLSVSSLPRLDILKAELLSPENRVGIGTSLLAFRYANWEYPVRERSFDRWGALTGERFYNTKSRYLIDYLPVSIYFLPYTWREQGHKSGNIKLFYEYSGTWLKKDQHDLSASCDYADNSLGNRTVQEYGAIYDPGGAFRFKIGHAAIRRAASQCENSSAGKIYNFGSLNVSNWYAGIELLFWGKSSISSAAPEIKNAENPLVDDLYERLIFGKRKEERSLAMEKPARLKVESASFKDSGNTGGLIGGDSALIVLKVKNYGGLAGNLKALVKCGAPNIKIQPLFDLDDLKTGETKRLEIPVVSDYELKTGTASVTITFQEENRNPPDPVKMQFQTFRLIPPTFKIDGINIDDGSYQEKNRLAYGNGNGIVEPGESAEVSLILKNEGGDARAVKAELVVEDDETEIRTLADGNIAEIYEIGALGNKDWRELKFAISVSKLYKASRKHPFSLSISEQRGRFNTKLVLPIAVNKALPVMQKINITPLAKKDHKPAPAPTYGDELLNVPETRVSNKDGVAVIIGVKNYSNKNVPPVDYALNDSGLMKEYLIKALGYQEGNIIYMENPTKADLENVFGNKDSYKGQLYDYVKKGKSDVFVYYTGHGAPDLDSKKGYFVPSDSDPNYVRFSGYPLEVFYENLSKVPAREINVVVDACFSGISEKGTIIAKASPLLVVPVIPGAGKLNIFSSSKAEEVSSWYPDKRHSLFTYFFLKGLQGAADKNKDGNITNGELYDYVSENVPYLARRLYGRNQNPSFIGKVGDTIFKY